MTSCRKPYNDVIELYYNCVSVLCVADILLLLYAYMAANDIENPSVRYSDINTGLLTVTYG